MIESEDYAVDNDCPRQRKRISNGIGWAERDEEEGWLWLSR